MLCKSIVLISTNKRTRYGPIFRKEDIQLLILRKKVPGVFLVYITAIIPVFNRREGFYWFQPVLQYIEKL